MITYVKGELTEIFNNTIVVEAAGVGYEIMVPTSILGHLSNIGEIVKVYTYQNVKEDALDLYGFRSRDDLNIFKLLISVSGVGPKGALNILSTLTPDDLRYAVLSEDAKAITRAPGVGIKNAQKIIIELKDKLSAQDLLTADAGQTDTIKAAGHGPKDEAVEALMALGYSSSEALRAVRESIVTDDMDAEAILKQALKKLAFI